jgi:plasmid maintenance system killer protein
MIKSFTCRDTEKLFNDQRVRRSQAFERQARKRLMVLHAAPSLEALMLNPGNKFHTLKDAADKLKVGVRGDVRLGVNTDPRLLRLTSLIAELNENYAGLSLNVLETMSWDAAKELLSGNVDLAFTYTKPNDKKIEIRHIDWIEMAVVAPLIWKEHYENATMKDLTKLPWIWTSDHCPICELQNEYKPAPHGSRKVRGSGEPHLGYT